LPTFTQCVHTSADIHPMCAHVCRLSPNVCTRLPTFTRCVHTSADFHPWLCTMLALGSMVVHHAGPVGDDRFADHRGNSNQVPSRGDCCCWPGSAMITRGNSNQVPSRGDCCCWPGSAMITRSNSNQVPSRGDCCWPGSAMITRSNSNQVPWDPSRELQPGPLPWGLLLLARSALITRSNSNQVPWDPWLCTMLALGSMVVHHAGPWIHGCAPCWPGRR